MGGAAREVSLNKVQKSLLFIVMFIGVVLVPYSLDNDVWFLLNGGRYVLAHGIPYIEPFTIHEGMHFIMQQWLSGVVFWFVYKSFGPVGLVTLMVFVDACIIYVLFRVCMLVSRNNFLVAVFLTTIIGAFDSVVFIRTRPQIFSALFLLLALFFLEKYSITHKKKNLVYLPVLSVLLINMHAALWPMLLVLMVPFILEGLLLKGSDYVRFTESAPIKPILLCACAVVLAALLNPYGTEAMSYTTRSYGYTVINSLVGEMKPIEITTIFGKSMLLCIILLSICFMKRKTPLRYILLSIGTAYMALSATRSLFLFSLLGMFPLAYSFQGYRFSQPVHGVQSAKDYWIKNICMLMLLMAISGGIYHQRQAFLENITRLSWISLGAMGMAALIFLRAMFLQAKKRIKPARKVTIQNQLVRICLFLAVLQIICSVDARYNKPDFEPATKPMIDFLLEHESAAGIVLWTDYDNGNYAEFRGIKCYLDTRAEVFLPKNNWQKNILQEYVDVEEKTIYYKDFIERYPFNYFLTGKGRSILFIFTER